MMMRFMSPSSRSRQGAIQWIIGGGEQAAWITDNDDKLYHYSGVMEKRLD
jgi:hypothetical protein